MGIAEGILLGIKGFLAIGNARAGAGGYAWEKRSQPIPTGILLLVVLVVVAGLFYAFKK